MSNQSFKVRNGLTLTPVDLTTLLNPQAGDMACDINDSNKIKRYDAANVKWVEVGSGGAAALDVLFQDDFENSVLSDYTHVGLTLDTVSPLNDAVSAKLTHQPATSQYFERTYAVDEKFRNKNITAKFAIKSAASAGNVTVTITDVTNATVLVNGEALELSSASGGTVASVAFDMPATCVSLRYRITALQESGSPVTVVDDVIFEITSLAEYTAVVQEQDSILTAIGNSGQSITASVTDIPFTLSSNIGSSIQYNGESFSVLEDGVYSISSGVVFTSAADRVLDLYVDGTLTHRLSDRSTQTSHAGAITLNLTTGKVYSLRVGPNGGTLSNSTVHTLIVTKQGSLKQVSVNSNQKVTIPTSELRFEGASARGTGAETAIVKFDSVANLRGDAFEIDNSNGTKVTMKKKGRLSVSAQVNASSGAQLNITKNQATLTSSSSVPGEVIGGGYMSTAGNFAQAAGSTDVNIGDVIRVTMSQNPNSNAANMLNLNFQEQEIQVSVSNTLPQFSESDIVVEGFGNAGQSITANVTDIPFSATVDTNGAWDGSKFTAPDSGEYAISGSTFYTAATTRTHNAYINGIQRILLGVNNATSTCSFSGTVTLQKGQTLSVRSNQSGTLSNTASNHNLHISKVGKPNVTGVDVTPFVNVPQPERQSSELSFVGDVGVATLTGSLTASKGSGIYSYNSSTGVYTVLKACTVNASFSGRRTTTDIFLTISRNGSVVAWDRSIESNSYVSCSIAGVSANVGDTFNFANGSGGTTEVNAFFSAVANSEQILTPTESFSTDTANLTYAPSSLYTLSTLANAPVGTFITFTYAANTNTRTQTTTRPTQTDANMNVNGIRIYARAYDTASTAANPSVVAIQVGKGLKGYSLDAKDDTLTHAATLDYSALSSVTERGMEIKAYDPITGVLYLDAGRSGLSTITSHSFMNSNTTTTLSAYVKINASKSPALTGVPLFIPRIATITNEQPSGTALASVPTTYTATTLNTLRDSSGIVTSLSSNQFTLPAGTYQIMAHLPAKQTTVAGNSYKTKLRNVTAGTDAIIGQAVAIATENVGRGYSSTSVISGEVTVSSPTVFEIQHRAAGAGAVLGQNPNFGGDEIFTTVRIQKIK